MKRHSYAVPLDYYCSIYYWRLYLITCNRAKSSVLHDCRRTVQGEILYAKLRDFLTNESTASENLDESCTSEAPSGDAARLTMAFSLAVRKGLSLGLAEMWVVMPIRSLDASYGF